MRVLIVVLAVLLALPSLGLAKPRKRPPKKAAGKAPAADVRGAVKEERGKKSLAAEANGGEKRRAGGRDKDPRMDAPGKESGAVGGGNPALQRGTRLEFDGRLVQGQTARSGAVYLFERARSELRSMVRERQSYRDEIVKTVFPEGGREVPKR
ncbi:MAG: hypothetical protein HY906_28360 [Deltaproteobacteria bacterium]|nr:hypothetical protein [Deltaproteobacteria bacterium]